MSPARVMIGFEVPSGAPAATFSAWLVDRLRSAGFQPSVVLAEQSVNEVRATAHRTAAVALWTTAAGQEIQAQVTVRDGERCRYCGGIAAADADPRDPSRRKLDMIDPFGALDTSNVVVACLSCVVRKIGRTVDAAGMTVLPAPAITSRSGRRKTDNATAAKAGV